MKKFLSVMLALLMVLSVFALSGCKKETAEEEKKTNAELFACALEQLMIPKMAEGLIDADLIKNANSFSFAIDELSISNISGIGSAEMPTLPNFAIDVLKFDDDNIRISGEVTLDDEKLGGVLELDGETIYLSVPEATDLYLKGTTDDLLELTMFTTGGSNEDLETVKSAFASMASAAEGLASDILSDDYLTSETVDVEVFGEEVSLNKLAVSLDEKDLVDLGKKFYDALPEDMKEDEEVDWEIPEGFEMKLEVAAYLYGEALNKLEIKADITEEDLSVKMDGAYDLVNTADTYKIDGEFTVSMDGEDVMILDSKGEVTLKDGKLDGKIKTKPEINLPEEATEDADGAVAAAMLEDLEFSAEYEGEISDDGFDIAIENEISVGGMAIKIPTTVKGETTDGSLKLDVDMELSLMGAGFKLGMTALAADAELEKDEYDADNAVAFDDQEKLDEFVSAIDEHVNGLEKLAELFASGDEGYYGDEDYDDAFDDDYSPTLFNIYNDTEDIYFFENGTGVISTEYDLVYDVVAGTFELTADDGTSTVITLTGVDTAESDGYEFMYDMYEYDDGDIDYYFHSEELGVDVSAHPYDDVAYIETPFTYIMDDTTITIGTTEMDYTLDEDAEIMILDGEEYDYFSYVE